MRPAIERSCYHLSQWLGAYLVGTLHLVIHAGMDGTIIAVSFMNTNVSCTKWPM